MPTLCNSAAFLSHAQLPGAVGRLTITCKDKAKHTTCPLVLPREGTVPFPAEPFAVYRLPNGKQGRDLIDDKQDIGQANPWTCFLTCL